MSRWVDYDAIDYRNDRLHDKSEEFLNGVIYMAQRIEEAPSIDIVRCQDCRHRYMDADLQVWTCTYGLMIKPDGFCNYGEVRDE